MGFVAYLTNDKIHQPRRKATLFAGGVGQWEWSITGQDKHNHQKRRSGDRERCPRVSRWNRHWPVISLWRARQERHAHSEPQTNPSQARTRTYGIKPLHTYIHIHTYTTTNTNHSATHTHKLHHLMLPVSFRGKGWPNWPSELKRTYCCEGKRYTGMGWSRVWDRARSVCSCQGMCTVRYRVFATPIIYVIIFIIFYVIIMF